MLSFKEFINEQIDPKDLNINQTGKPKTDTYALLGGDRYDGGFVVKVVIKKREVFAEVYVGSNSDFKYKNKTYSSVYPFVDAIAKGEGIKNGIMGLEVVRDDD